ncbi:MAG: hypothetical protein WBN41_14175 [Lysobacterales bacterium]
MKKLLLIVLALSLHCTVHAAEGFSTLEERMSGKEFKETGLGKLTEAELSALNDWLRRHSVATLENVTARPASGTSVSGATTRTGTTQDLRGFPNQPKGEPEDDVINSRIVGTFDGWEKKGTLFKLANGMIWQMTENDSFHIPPVENPEVVIKKGFMNKWKLSLPGHKDKVSVQRIQ